MEALRDSEEKYRVLYENAPLSYQSLDEDGRFLDVNPAWLSVMRHTPLDKNSYF
jgi:PAS domain S-box-containing protein